MDTLAILGYAKLGGCAPGIFFNLKDIRWCIHVNSIETVPGSDWLDCSQIAHISSMSAKSATTSAQGIL